MNIGDELVKTDFLAAVSSRSGTRVITCYQCGKCSAGCPMADDMDILPHQVMRMVQLEMRETLFKSRAFWLCVSCEACTSRCPKGLDIAAVMDALRIMSLAKGYQPADRPIAEFNRLFLANIRKHGRLNEVALASLFMLRTLRPLRDLLLGPTLYRKGKISLSTQKVSDINSVERIFALAAPFAEKTESDEGRHHG